MESCDGEGMAVGAFEGLREEVGEWAGVASSDSQSVDCARLSAVPLLPHSADEVA